MKNQIKSNKKKELAKATFISKVTELENIMLATDSPLIAKGNSDMFPLKHTFADGIYVREMKMERGGLVIGKIHKHEHVWFLLSGEIEVATETGTERYIAPCYVVAPSGTKRVLRAMEDSVFVNIHANPTNTRDIDELESNYICNSFSEYDKYKLLK